MQLQEVRRDAALGEIAIVREYLDRGISSERNEGRRSISCLQIVEEGCRLRRRIPLRQICSELPRLVNALRESARSIDFIALHRGVNLNADWAARLGISVLPSEFERELIRDEVRWDWLWQLSTGRGWEDPT